MGNKQKEEKNIFDSLNSIINTAYGLNNKCLTVLNQIKRADELDVSETTKDWLNRKREVYADERERVNNINYQNIVGNLDLIQNNIKVLKEKIVKMYAQINPNSNKTFDQLFSDEGIVDEALKKENDENLERESKNEKLKNELFWAAASEYYATITFLESYKQYVDMFETVRSLVSYDGYKTWFTGIIPENLCEIDENTIMELNSFVADLKFNYKADILKTEVAMNKTLKKLAKTPENEALLQQFAELQNQYETLIHFEQVYADLTKKAGYLSERFKCANSSQYGLSNEIVELMGDLGFSVPKEIRKFNNGVKVSSVFAGKLEIVDIIHLCKDFKNSAALIQKLSYVAQATTTIPMVNFEESKLMIEELITNAQDSETLAERFKKSKQQTGTEKQNDEDNEVKKHLMFETPFGVLWCDGKQLINSKTGEIVDVNKINNTHYNPEKNVFYEIVSAQQKTSDLKEQSNNGMQPDGGKSK